MDKASFVYGMVTAFCECVAAGCKPLALSPPLRDADYAAMQAEAYRLVAAHGLLAYHERNADLPPETRAHWIVIYAQEHTLADYLALRASGLNPMTDLNAFASVLGYGESRIHTGYDAYHALFPD